MQAVFANIDFMGKRKFALVFSTLLVFVSVASLTLQGLNLGLDYTGGVLLEVSYPQPVRLNELRKSLQQTPYADASIQNFGTARSLLLRMAPKQTIDHEALGKQLMSALDTAVGQQGELRRVEFVGPQAGKELAFDGALAALIAVVGILLYVYWRFEWRLGVGSIIALVHDVLVVLGVFSVFQLEFDLTVLAAVLAVIGYSLNDTIVVYDRIRELFQRTRKSSVVEVMNLAVNQTLSRTMITSWTVILVLAAMLIFGGKIIHYFSLALLIGVLMGTYSSIYVASPLALWLGLTRQDLLPVERAEIDGRP